MPIMKITFTTLLLSCLISLQAQNFTYQAALQTVVFSGGEMYDLRQDDNTGFIDTDLHWSADGTTNPAGFPAGSTL